MSHLSEEQLAAAAAEVSYNGTPGIAASESFRRESSLAMELILKAGIAARFTQLARADPSRRDTIPKSHDIPKLWKLAELEPLGREDNSRLLLMKSTLLWSGRYRIPTSEEAWTNESRELEALEEPRGPRRLLPFRKPVALGWIEFDRLYQAAEAHLRRLINSYSAY